MADKIDFWTVEGSIYPSLDSMGMNGETRYKKGDFDLGANQKLSIQVASKNGSPILLNQQFKSSDISFSMDFRSGNDNWFRVDNQGNHKNLHLHLESGAQPFDCRITVPENTSVSQLISDTFEKAEEIVKWKFPDFKICSGVDFVGTK